MKEYQTMVTNNQLYLPKFPLIDFEEFLLERYFPNDREQYSYNLAYVMSFLLKTVCYYQISKDSINQHKIDLDNIGHDDDEMLIKDLYDKIIRVLFDNESIEIKYYKL